MNIISQSARLSITGALVALATAAATPAAAHMPTPSTAQLPAPLTVQLPAPLILQMPSAERMPADYASRLEARLGETHVVAGAAIGLVAGAGAAYLLLYSGGSTSLCDRDANQDALNRRECVGLVIGGGVVGAALGALVGNRIRRGSSGLRLYPAR